MMGLWFSLLFAALPAGAQGAPECAGLVQKTIDGVKTNALWDPRRHCEQAAAAIEAAKVAPDTATLAEAKIRFDAAFKLLDDDRNIVLESAQSYGSPGPNPMNPGATARLFAINGASNTLKPQFNTAYEKKATELQVDSLVAKIPAPAAGGDNGGNPVPTPKLGDLKKAEDSVNKHAPADAGIQTTLAKGYLALESPGDAVRTASQAISLNSNAADGWAIRAAAQLQTGNSTAALSDARKALSLDPQNSVAQTVESYVTSKTSGRAGKFPDFRSMLSPGSGGGAVKTSAKSAGSGVSDGASTAELLRSGPPSSAPDTPSEKIVKEAENKLRLKDFPGALLEASRAIELDPKNPDAWAARAEVSNKLGNYEAAVKDATQALALDPGNAKAYRERSYAQYQLGNYQAAFDDADKAVKLDPKNAMGYLYRAMAREKLGDVPGALKDYQTAAQLDSSLKPFYDQALARHGGGPTESAAPSPKRYAWLLISAGLIAALLMAFASRGKRETTGPGSVQLSQPAAGPSRPAALSAAAPSPARSGTLPPGALLGGSYRLTGELGRGGMGIVYDAMDVRLDRRVAIKQLRSELASPDALSRFLREARLAAKLKHPGIVSVLTVVEQDGEAFLVFEYVDGETLDKKLERAGKLSFKDARQVLTDVCEALGYAHGQRIIHRDLKPSNILVELSGRARVMDFGIAHQSRTSSKETSTAPWGTPAYMAPEQAMGRVSAASDLYALGATAYELLTGRLPFGGTGEDKLNKLFLAPSKLGQPAAADAFFEKALEPDPAKRFASAAEFLKAFERIGAAPAPQT